MRADIALELQRRAVINAMIDKIVLSNFDKVENCHVHMRRQAIQDFIRNIIGVKDSYQFRRAVTERMAALGFKPVQLHGRGFYKYIKPKGGDDDLGKGAKSA